MDSRCRLDTYWNHRFPEASRLRELIKVFSKKMMSQAQYKGNESEVMH